VISWSQGLRYQLLEKLTNALLFFQFGVDQTRFFMMSEIAFGKDGDYSEQSFIYRVNNCLANQLGNLVQRTLSMAYKNCNAAVPENIGEFLPEDMALLERAYSLRQTASEHMSTQSILKYVEALIHLISQANTYIDEMAPWGLRKTNPDRMATVIYVIMETLRYAVIMYQPVIPDSASKILDALTVPKDERTFAHLSDAYKVQPGAKISKPEGIFPRIEIPDLVEA
jgi:methionyl-tRNA synthetase